MALFNRKQQTVSKTTSQTKSDGSLTHKPARFGAVLRPRVTEKAFRVAEHNQYVFDIDRSVSKQEAAKQIAALYGVTVVRSQVVRTKGVKPSLRGLAGGSVSYKKIIITVAKGQQIDITGKA